MVLVLVHAWGGAATCFCHIAALPPSPWHYCITTPITPLFRWEAGEGSNRLPFAGATCAQVLLVCAHMSGPQLITLISLAAGAGAEAAGLAPDSDISGGGSTTKQGDGRTSGWGWMGMRFAKAQQNTEGKGEFSASISFDKTGYPDCVENWTTAQIHPGLVRAHLYIWSLCCFFWILEDEIVLLTSHVWNWYLQRE